MNYSFMAEANAYCKKIKINRPKDWPDLDMSIIESECSDISSYEYKMIMNNCKTEQLAIKAIKNKRQSDLDFNEFMSETETTKRREKYFRKKINDLEEDNEDRFNKQPRKAIHTEKVF